MDIDSFLSALNVTSETLRLLMSLDPGNVVTREHLNRTIESAVNTTTGLLKSFVHESDAKVCNIHQFFFFLLFPQIFFLFVKTNQN
jgi:hypothetical protein